MTDLLFPTSQNFVQKTLGAALNAGATTVTLNNVTGIQNKPGVFIVDRVNTGGVETPSTREVIKFTGTSGSTLTGLTRNFDGGGSDQDHAIGAIVEFTADAMWADGVMDALENAFTSTGAVDTTKIVTLTASQTLTNKTLTAPIISTISNTGTVTLPTATDTLVGKATTDTLTNKRITQRVSTETSSATPTINTDNVDMHTITALATAITSMTTNLSGTPTNGQKLIIRILDNGTARAITWGASFASRGATLPTTTVLSKYQYNGFIWNSTTSTWDLVATTNEA